MAVEGHATQQNRKVDPNVKIPDAVKRAAARSDQMIADNTPKPAGASSATSVTAFDPKNPNPPEPVVATTPPAPVPITPSVPNPAPGASGDGANGEPNYKHMFESTNGRLAREVQERTMLARQLADTQRTLAAMSVPQPPQAPQNGGADVRFTPGQRKLSQKEIAEYGEELIDVMGRRAQEVYDPIVGQLQAEIAALKGQTASVRNVQAQDQTERLFETLDRELPNWRQQNNDPNFMSWLTYPDELSGVPRQELLTAAFKAGHTARVAAAFRGFQAYQAASDPAAAARQNPGAEVTRQSNPAPGVDLASLAAPGRAKSGQATAPPEKPEVTRAEIAQFYRDVTTGKYNGRDADKAAIEMQIQSAVQEGRIR